MCVDVIAFTQIANALWHGDTVILAGYMVGNKINNHL